jgi:hypothetical protein
MHINEYLEVADQIDALIDRAIRTGPFTEPMSRDEILSGLYQMAVNLRSKANAIDSDMAREASE